MTIERSALPANVRRWLDRSFPSDAPVPSTISNTQYLFKNNLASCGRGVHLIPHPKREVIS